MPGFLLGKFEGSTIAFDKCHKQFFDHIWHMDIESILVAILGFVDDLFLLAKSCCELSSMLDDLGKELEEIADLHLQDLKLEYMTNDHVPDPNATVFYQGKLVSKVDQLVCLGSIRRTDMNEMLTVLHRVCKAWGTFHKWQPILQCRAVPIETRLDFWAKTVSASLTWGLETTRASKRLLDVAKRAQRHMIAQMLKRKRRTVSPDGAYQEGGEVETYLQFNIRVNREIKVLITNSRPKQDVRRIIQTKKRSFATHIAHFGLDNREEHLVKHIALWRNCFWWRIQRKEIIAGKSGFTHPRVGKLARWELQFPNTWICDFCVDSFTF